MSNLFAARSGMLTRLFTVTALAGLLIGVGCSDDDDDGNGGTPTPTTSFSGAFIGSGDGGKISVTVNTATLAPGLRASKLERGVGGSRILRAGSLVAHGIAASGSIDLSGGSVVPLTGTYNDETDTLNLTGGGYAFVGVADTTGANDGILGGYLGPNGAGLFACAAGTGVQVFCGTFTNSGATVEGRWNMVIQGDDAFAGAVEYGTTNILGMEGTITGTGNPRTITLAGGNGVELAATGSWDITTNIITGDWETSDGISVLDSGTWQATPCE